MKRRDFLKALLGTAFYASGRRVFALDVDHFDVGIAVDSDYERAVRSAIDLVGGIRSYVRPGDIVAVKPNMAFNSAPEFRATTHPLVVRTVIHLCFEAMASKVYLFDRTVSNPRLSYVNSGIQEAAREAGARVEFADTINSRTYKSVGIPAGSHLKESTVFHRVLESDVLINVPVAKHHSSAGLTLGMKNMMGVTGDNRSRWHWQLHDAISDFNLVVPSHLTVIDATTIMTRGGPTGGSLSFLQRKDTVIASANVIQADSEAAKLFGIDAASVGYLRLGQTKGIGALSGYTVGRAPGV
jgi:uncharacterized protein (DUF362 family)